MKIVSGTQIDVGDTTYALDQLEPVRKAVDDVVRRLANEAMKELLTSSTFLSIEGEDQDPLKWVMVVPDDCLLEIDMREALEREIDAFIEHGGSGSCLSRVSVAMREMSDKIDSALASRPTDS